ncbi:hypothetical protein ANN_02418 [Periplaneta americana]|uniref:Reverse transcriptase n=1 Tax=Periplaneta americana TaxID=6978 RepID=A0ABQ8TXC1_PERAM|nr:hypothetical protein ANN_02418 [Periplaneta americana]
MVAVTKWVLLFAGIALASAFPAAEDFEARSSQNVVATEDSASLLEEGVERAYRFLQSCGDKDMSLCVKMRALTFVDRALRRPGDVDIVDGVSLVRTQDGMDVSRELNGRALSEAELDASLPKNADERDAQVETLLVDRVAKFLQSHTLQLKVPDYAITEVRKTLDEGVILNKEFPPANSWIRNHKGLTLLEWIDALKMVGYVAPVRAVPGRSRDGTRCRRCLSEIQTLPHILGFCPYSEALRNIRHHAVRSILAETLKEVGFTVHQEVQGLATQGSVRRIDIVAIKNNAAYILRLTIRFETHADQPHEVDSEKKRIYEPTITFYKDKYSLSHIDVIGLMVGARGTIPSFFANKCKNLSLTHSIVKEIAISALKGSVQILRNHLYGSDNGNFKLS